MLVNKFVLHLIIVFESNTSHTTTKLSVKQSILHVSMAFYVWVNISFQCITFHLLCNIRPLDSLKFRSKHYLVPQLFLIFSQISYNIQWWNTQIPFCKIRNKNERNTINFLINVIYTANKRKSQQIPHNTRISFSFVEKSKQIPHKTRSYFSFVKNGKFRSVFLKTAVNASWNFRKFLIIY